MKNTQKNFHVLSLPAAVAECCGFQSSDRMEHHAAESILITLKARMTAIELVQAVDFLHELSMELIVALAQSCRICDNCGGESECHEQCADCAPGCADSPVEWVENCVHCNNLLSEANAVQIPEEVLQEAGIGGDAKLDAFVDEDGVISVTEADHKHDLTDVPEEIIAMLAQSGVCLAELDELIRQEEIVYGE